jgi:hypothetical protein
VVSTPALQRRNQQGCEPGDYATPNSNHLRDGTAGDPFCLSVGADVCRTVDGRGSSLIARSSPALDDLFHPPRGLRAIGATLCRISLAPTVTHTVKGRKNSARDRSAARQFGWPELKEHPGLTSAAAGKRSSASSCRGGGIASTACRPTSRRLREGSSRRSRGDSRAS